MKRYTLLFILIGISFFNYAQQWVDLKPFSNKSLGRTSFVSEKDGFIFIDNILVRTRDGAITFDTIYQIVDSQEIVFKFQMVDTLNGFLYKSWTNEYDYNDEKYYFMKTEDGGKSWIDITDTSNLLSWLYFYFMNKNIGFCTGWYYDSNMVLHTGIFKTINGGNNWYRVNDPLTTSHEYYFIKKFYFIDSLHGWVACYLPTDSGFTLYTKDGGENWEYGIESSVDLFDIHFIDLNKGGSVGYNPFYSRVALTETNFQSFSYDYQSWELDFMQYAKAIYYKDDTTIWVTGEPGKIYRSTNSGESFELFQDFPSQSFYKIQFFDKTGYLFSNRSIFKYMDTTTNIVNDNFYKTHKINIYPNPTSHVFNIEFNKKEADDVNVKLLNINGSIIFSDDILQNNHTIIKKEFNISNLQTGIYFLEIKNNTRKYYSKIIKL